MTRNFERARKSIFDFFVPADLKSIEERQRWRFSVLMGLATSLSSAGYACVYGLLGAPVGAVVLTCSSALVILFMLCSKRTGRLDVFFMLGAILIMITLAFMSITTGRFGLAFFMWFFLVPAGTLLSLGLSKMWAMTATGLLLGGLAFIMPYLDVDLGNLPLGDSAWNIINYCSWIFFMLAGSTLAVMLKTLYQHMETERQRLQDTTENSRRMRAVGELAGGVAHEFNNLLTVIQGTASFLRGDASREQLVEEGLTDIEHAAMRGGEIVRELLLFARCQQDNRIEVADTVESLHASLRMIKPMLASDVELASSIPHDLPSVAVDARTVEQSVVSIVLNARDAMKSKDGRGEIRIEAELVRLNTLQASSLDVAPGPWVCVVVEDNGIGMDAETVARIYEPFFTTKEEGTGLGLAVVFGLLRRAGGTIHAESEPGVGTRFAMYLPVALIPDASESFAANTPTSTGGAPR